MFQFLSSDTEIPIISNTPPTQNVNTDVGSPNATVSWTPPTASDNSGEAVTLTSDYTPGDTFPIGTTTVTYKATDTNGNVGTSTFTVVVTGKYDGYLDNSRNGGQGGLRWRPSCTAGPPPRGNIDC